MQPCTHTCGNCKEEGFNKAGSSLQRHEQNLKLHPNCTVTCPAHHKLPAPPTVSQEEEISTVRALYVLRPTFFPPTDRRSAKENQEMYPLSYRHVTNMDPETGMEERRKERKWLKDIQDATATCRYDHKGSDTLYVQEWVSNN